MPTNPSHIYWFAHYNMLGPCTRYRGKYLLEQLEKDYGIPYSFVYPSYQARRLFQFLQVYFRALCFRRQNSIIVFQKTYTVGIYASLLRFLLAVRKRNTFYDIDDAYYVKFPPQTIAHFVKHVPTVITGSKSLTGYAIKTSGNPKKVFTLPSPIFKQPQNTYPPQDLFTIGWAGFYNYHRESLLQLLFPALLKLEFDCKVILLGVVKPEHFKEISAYFEDAKHITVETPSIDWINETAFYNWVRKFDLGVSPLLDTEMNRAKSAFKLKQYLCCGVPVIGSNTGENSTIINPSVNGYVANNSAAFYQQIYTFKNLTIAEKQAMSRSAATSVASFEMDNYASDFLNIVRLSSAFES